MPGCTMPSGDCSAKSKRGAVADQWDRAEEMIDGFAGRNGLASGAAYGKSHTGDENDDDE